MSRWRAPRPASTAVISPQGFALLEQELHQLWKVERPQVTAVVSAAAKNGDRSENGDYIYGKRRLGEIDWRVRYLQKRLKNLQVIDQKPTDPSKVYFGARVEVEDPEGESLIVTIVGPDEINPDKKHISIDSPLARALLGKSVDDEVKFESPAGVNIKYLLAIDYDWQ
jgi:transcription elongation factor GreB